MLLGVEGILGLGVLLVECLDDDAVGAGVAEEGKMQLVLVLEVSQVLPHGRCFYG